MIIYVQEHEEATYGGVRSSTHSLEVSAGMTGFFHLTTGTGSSSVAEGEGKGEEGRERGRKGRGREGGREGGRERKERECAI